MCCKHKVDFTFVFRTLLLSLMMMQKKKGPRPRRKRSGSTWFAGLRPSRRMHLQLKLPRQALWLVIFSCVCMSICIYSGMDFHCCNGSHAYMHGDSGESCGRGKEVFCICDTAFCIMHVLFIKVQPSHHLR